MFSVSGMLRRVVAVVAVCVPTVAALAFAAPVRADHDRMVVSQCGPSFSQGGYGGRYRSYVEIERERGAAAGYRAGWRQGFEDGYHGRGHNCSCTIDLSCYSRAYRRGFTFAFEQAYNAAYRAGALQRERSQGGGYYPCR